MIQLMTLPIVMGVILTGILAYLGIHIVKREVIFVDLALAQIAALGAAVGVLVGLEPQGFRPTALPWCSCCWAPLSSPSPR